MTPQVGLRPPALTPALRRPLGWASVGAAVVVVGLGILLAGSSTASGLDVLVLDTANRLVPVGRWSYLVDSVGEPAGAVTVIVVLAALCLVAGRWRLAVLTVVGQALAGGVSGLAKSVVDRTIHGGFLSYPSGHTAGATAFALVFALLVVDVLHVGGRVRALLVVAFPVVVGTVAAWAQIVIVAHYPTDTVGGFCLAVVLVPPAAMLVDLAADRVVRSTDPLGP